MSVQQNGFNYMNLILFSKDRGRSRGVGSYRCQESKPHFAAIANRGPRKDSAGSVRAVTSSARCRFAVSQAVPGLPGPAPAGTLVY